MHGDEDDETRLLTPYGMDKKQLLDLLNKEFIFLSEEGAPIRRSEVMNLLKERSLHMGIDLTKEVLDVWYEVTFLRFLLTDILQKAPTLAEHITDETYDRCRKQAQVFLLQRFKRTPEPEMMPDDDHNNQPS